MRKKNRKNKVPRKKISNLFQPFSIYSSAFQASNPYFRETALISEEIPFLCKFCENREHDQA